MIIVVELNYTVGCEEFVVRFLDVIKNANPDGIIRFWSERIW